MVSLLIGSDCDYIIVHLGVLYSYFGNFTGDSNAFRALQHGFTHWSSGQLKKLDVHFLHPLYCHIRCQMTPSMKQGNYNVYILLGCTGEMAVIERASCECAAGYVFVICITITLFYHSKSASCTHISALLHAVSSLTAHRIGSTQSVIAVNSHHEDEALPITSYFCQWKQPRTRKKSNMPVSDAVFHKHVYGRVPKQQSMEEFDPRPLELRNTARERLQDFLSKNSNKDLGVSVLFEESYRCWSISQQQPTTPALP